jgi:hypothetical protein
MIMIMMIMIMIIIIIIIIIIILFYTTTIQTHARLHPPDTTAKRGREAAAALR